MVRMREVTGTAPAHAARFLVELDQADDPTWWLLDRERRIVAWSGQGFPTLGHADRAAHEFRVQPRAPLYRVHRRSDDLWWWSAWASDGARVAISGAWFHTEASAGAAAAAIPSLVSAALGP